MRKSNTNITRYTSGMYYVDIVETRKFYEAWIGHNECVVSQFMFGMPKAQQPLDEFLGYVWDSFPRYKVLFNEEHMEG